MSFWSRAICALLGEQVSMPNEAFSIRARRVVALIIKGRRSLGVILKQVLFRSAILCCLSLLKSLGQSSESLVPSYICDLLGSISWWSTFWGTWIAWTLLCILLPILLLVGLVSNIAHLSWFARGSTTSRVSEVVIVSVAY